MSRTWQLFFNVRCQKSVRNLFYGANSMRHGSYGGVGSSSRLYSIETSTVSSEIAFPSFKEENHYEPKIVKLVDDIANLTLREVADLNELLKSTLNIKEIAVVSSAAPAADSGSKEAEEEKVPEKTEFAIKLIGFEAANKIKLIKALKLVKPSLNLVQAKKFVESIPQVIMEDLPKEECDDIKKTLEEAGGKLEII